MNDDEDKFSLRDKIAIDFIKDFVMADQQIKFYCETDIEEYEHEFEKNVFNKIKIAYKIADMIRKERLNTFK